MGIDAKGGEMSIKVPAVNAEQHIGLLFQKKGPISWIEAMPELRARLLDEGRLPITIEMPCSQTVRYKTFEDIPLEDVPCPCGNPGHWLVKWVSQE